MAFLTRPKAANLNVGDGYAHGCDHDLIIERTLNNRAYCLEAATISPIPAVAKAMRQLADNWAKFAANIEVDHKLIVSSRKLLRAAEALLDQGGQINPTAGSARDPT